MTRLMQIILGATLVVGVPVFEQEPVREVGPIATQSRVETSAIEREKKEIAEATNVMRDYGGVRLGMPVEAVRTLMGDQTRRGENWDEFKLEKSDLMTVHYDNGVVKAIQLYFTDPDRAPEFAEVVGDIELTVKENGAKFARRDVEDEGFWVSMYQSADRTVTTISLGRVP